MKKGLFIFVIGLIVGFLMPSCSSDDESESSSIMETFYAESVNLNAASQEVEWDRGRGSKILNIKHRRLKGHYIIFYT